MIMQEQELTLFGGWAKARIPQPIETGVVKSSDKLSVSTYTSSSYAGEPFSFDDLGDGFLSPHITAEPSKVTEYMKPLIEIEITCRGYSGEAFTVKDWRSSLKDQWIGLAFSRFFEIWGKGSLNDMMRGYLGKKRLQRSFSGKIGCNNGDLAHTKDKPLTRLTNGLWTLKPGHRISNQYPHSRYLPPEGVKNAREHARELKQKREKGLIP